MAFARPFARNAKTAPIPFGVVLVPTPDPEPEEFDADALAFLTAVETADGEELEAGVKSLVNGLVVNLKSDGLWSKIDQCGLMVGAKTLAGACVTLKGDPLQSVTAFVEDDYSRTLGLKGDGESKWMNAAMTTFSQNDAHMAVFLGEAHSTNDDVGRCFFGNNNSSGGSRLNYHKTNRRPVINGASEKVNAGTDFNASLYGVSRANATEFQEHYNGTTATFEEASVAPSGNGLRVFARQFGGGGANSYTFARLAWWSHGGAIDLSTLDAHLSAFMSALQSELS